MMANVHPGGSGGGGGGEENVPLVSLHTVRSNRAWLYRICIDALVLVIGIVLGTVIMWAVYKGTDSNSTSPKSQVTIPDIYVKNAPDFSEKEDQLLETISAARLKGYLDKIAGVPHLAGTSNSLKVANYLKDFYESDLGFETKLLEYEVLLSYPKINETTKEYIPSHLIITAQNNSLIFKSSGVEPPILEKYNQSGVLPAFLAFAASGEFNATNIVYVNYGRIEDFKYLFAKTNDSKFLQGKFALMRYGQVFRGDKVKMAQKYGAAGAMLYLDRFDFGPPPNSTIPPYPKTQFLPRHGIQRGGLVMIDGGGDLETPGYPSTINAFRNKTYARDKIFKIPAIVIDPSEAEYLLQQMTDGASAPTNWTGALNATYRVAGQFPQSTSRLQFSLVVNTELQREKIYNMVSILKGSIDPDRYVVVGNHHDAWVYGALDPNSGTIAIMELARSFSELIRKGWKSRRSIVFCHWDGEEAGIIGSGEFTEQFASILSQRTVAYVNLDTAVSGTFSMTSETAPVLTDYAFKASKKVENPNKTEVSLGRRTVFDTWLHTHPSPSTKTTNEPNIGLVGSGSDYVSFSYRLGIPSIGFSYDDDPNSYDYGKYSLYHSRYETIYLYDKLLDPTFEFNQALSRVVASTVYQLSNAVILEFNTTRYAATIEGGFLSVNRTYFDVLHSHNLSQQFNNFELSVHKFTQQCIDFYFVTRAKAVKSNDILQIMQYNDQVIFLERIFIDPLGLPNRPFDRHVLFEPNANDLYDSSIFPGLVDALQADSIDWSLVEKELSVLTHFLDMGSNYLKHPSAFY